MKLYKTTIKPKSTFATPLQGDTIFGHICWIIFYKDEPKLKKLLENYKNGNPFLVVSDGFNKGYLPKPKMPSHLLGEDDDKKKNRKKVWLKLEDLQNADFTKALRDEETGQKDKEITTVKNSINYKYFKTDGGDFAPFGVKEYIFKEKDIYFLLDEEQFSLSELKEAFEELSKIGYGKDTTIGKGRFEFSDFEEIEPFFESNKFITLSASALKKDDEIKEIYYEPFTKFGKLGSLRANKNAFKKPLIFSKTASVVEFKEAQKREFIGCAIENISDSFKDVIHQGYAITIPIGEKR